MPSRKELKEGLPANSTLGFTLAKDFVNFNGMKTTALILTKLLIAICASGADCSPNAPDKVLDQNEYTIVSDSKNMPAIASVDFWEFSKAKTKDYVVDIFFLAKDSNDNNKTHLYVHELIPPKDDVWLRFPEDLKDCNEIQNCIRQGTWANPGDYTRSVSTGSGLIGAGTASACKGLTYKFCGHRDELTYDHAP